LIKKEDWHDFFKEDYLRFNDVILTEERTAYEVDQLTVMLKPGSKVLDLGCGQGRIAVALAAKGFKVTGYDASEVLLEAAKAYGKDAKATVDFISGDMRDLNFDRQFDAIVNIGTAFGYVPDEADDRKIMERMYKALVPGGRLIMDTENRENKLARMERRSWVTMKDTIVWSLRDYDCMSGRWNETISWIEEGNYKQAILDFRLYAATELRNMMQHAGFRIHGMFGGLDYSPLTLQSPRLVIVADAV